eukprot:TRINITY_DN5028_c0_g1_i1.p1 TRINITY_DN5028_c0_g1~~TRINITY_DN5028_c0_g1_i1.p1  ORF type:complete len:380 (+),score=121.20 TRINITY_DN5028_c0_g1_i1:1445-2584(+)
MDLTYQLSTKFSIYEEMGRQLDEAGWQRTKGTRFHLLLGDRFEIKYNQLLGKESLGAAQLVNYFPKTHLLTLKTALVRRLREQGAEHAWMPESYILMKEDSSAVKESDAADQSLPPWKRKTKVSKDVLEAIEDKKAFSSKGQTSTVWILKPSSGCGGQGIAISNDTKELLALVAKAPGKGMFVAQQYIARPLLLPGGRKFDLRCWVLLTWDFKLYLFSEGSLRTSSTTYNEDYHDLSAHVTNHCLQETLPDYGKYEEGNEMWYSAFSRFLTEEHPSRTLEADVLPQVKHIVLSTFDAVKDLLAVDPATSPYLPFQLFGYDFLIDAAFKVWLLEINGSPASAEKFKTEMVRDILRKSVTRQFPFMDAEVPEGAPHFEPIN